MKPGYKTHIRLAREENWVMLKLRKFGMMVNESRRKRDLHIAEARKIKDGC